MADGISTRIERGDAGLRLVIDVEDEGFAGKSATFELRQRVKVKRSSPVHKSRTLATRQLQLRQGRQEILLPELPRDAFAYTGSDIDVELVGELEIDDGLIFDTEIEIGLGRESRLPERQPAHPDHKSVHSPRDSFDFFANLRAIPAKARLIVLWLMLVGGPIVAVNAVVGVRDQFVPESQVWFYDHSGSDGSESPFMKALAGSGAVGFAIWMAIRHQLKKYMEFSARVPPVTLCRGASCTAAEVFSGSARVTLEGAVVRLVAYNREHGQYTKQEKSGNSTKTVTKSFVSPACGIVLYEESLFFLPPNQKLEESLSGEIRFDALFDVLYPPMMIGDSHGLSVQLEAQLLHPDFVDHDIELAVAAIEVEHFYQPSPGENPA